MSDFSDNNGQGELPESLLPYDAWLEDAYREVMLRALEYAQRNGLPGEHHLYISFLTDIAGVEIPGALRAQYPKEMTIVLQHQFWDLLVDREKEVVSVGLSFGGVGSTLVIPFGSITGFSDPSVGVAMGFRPVSPDATETTSEVSDDTPPDAPEPPGDGQVVQLDAFRKRPAT